MPHTTEPWNGMHLMRIHGAISPLESRGRVEELVRLTRDGALFVFVIYEEDVEFKAETTQNFSLQASAGDFLSTIEGGAMAFYCKSESTFGVSRQFQMVAGNNKVKISVFRDENEAKEWILAQRRDFEVSSGSASASAL